jgi:magnesium transporter
MIECYQIVAKKLEKLDRVVPGCWVNIHPPIAPGEIEQFAKDYEIELDFLMDSLDTDERSRYEKEEDVRLILVNAPTLNNSAPENESLYLTIPIGIVLTPDNVVTISSHKETVLNRFLDMKVKNFDPNNQQKFVLLIFEQIVRDYLHCLKLLNQKRNVIEKELYDSSRNQELRRLLSIEKSLVYFVNSLSANDLLKLKMKRTDFLEIRNDEVLTDLFEDIIIDNGQALEMSNVYTNILNGTMEAYASIISNNLNMVIQRLTLVTIILMVPTLVASLYGMNVPLPFKNSEYSFYFIIVFSVAISLFLAWFFRKRRLF